MKPGVVYWHPKDRQGLRLGVQHFPAGGLREVKEFIPMESAHIAKMHPRRRTLPGMKHAKPPGGLTDPGLPAIPESDLALYFNNCTDFSEPDWTRYDALEIAPCKNFTQSGYGVGGDDSTWVEQCARHEAEMWTIYGHLAEGGCEAITDCNTEELAIGVAAFLSQRWRIPVS